MAARYFNGEITEKPGAGNDAQDVVLIETFTVLAAKVGPQIDELAFNRALETIWQALDVANKYIVATSPFTLGDEEAQAWSDQPQGNVHA